MIKLNFQFINIKKYVYLLLLPFLCVLMLTCNSDTTLVDSSTGNAGTPLHILGPPNGQPTILSGSISQSNPNEFVIDATVLSAAGGNPLSNYTWTLSSLSSFPSGTTVEPLTGIFKWNGATTHVPAGSYPFKMTVSDGSSTATGNYIFVFTVYTILPTLLFQQPAISTFRLDTAIAGKNYGSSLFVTVGSSGPYSSNVYLPLTWVIESGNLPAGLTIDQHSGIVRGSPMSSASGQDYSFTIKVTNQNNEVASCGGNCPLYQIYVK